MSVDLGQAAQSTEPLLLRGAVRDWPAAAWTVASLAARVGEAQVPVHTGKWKEAGWRVARDGPTAQRRAADYLSELAAGRATGYLAGFELFKEVPALRKDLAFPRVGLFGVEVAWIGPAGTSTPVHFDLAPNLSAQLSGQKRWRLWRPERKLDGRLAGLGAFLMSKHDAGRGVDGLAAPDLDLVLEAGDLLVIPSGWWHRVDTLTEAIAVNRWWRFAAIGRALNRLRAPAGVGRSAG